MVLRASAPPTSGVAVLRLTAPSTNGVRSAFGGTRARWGSGARLEAGCHPGPREAPGEPLEGLVVRMFGERGRGPWVTGCHAGNGTCAEAQDGERPGTVTVVCAAESRRPRGTASEAAREPRLPRTPRMRVTRSLTVRAEVFRRAAQTPRLWHGADAPIRPACPEAGGWAVRPADTRGQVAPPGAASLCREPRSRSPPPALPLLGLASRYCVRSLSPHL